MIVKVGQYLHKKYPNSKLNLDVKAHNRPKITLTDGKEIYPDIMDETRKRIYEVHVKGQRKEDYFDKLPEGWYGVNVFYDEWMCPETIIFKEKIQRIQEIEWVKEAAVSIFDHLIGQEVYIKSKDKIGTVVAAIENQIFVKYDGEYAWCDPDELEKNKKGEG